MLVCLQKSVDIYPMYRFTFDWKQAVLQCNRFFCRYYGGSVTVVYSKGSYERSMLQIVLYYYVSV